MKLLKGDYLKDIIKILGKNMILLAVLILLGFILPRLIPGSPLAITEKDIDPRNLQLPIDTFNYFKEYYAPEESLIYQLNNFINQLIQGDLGYSFHYGLPVTELLKSRIGWTLFLSLTGLFLSILIALPLGTFLALTLNTFIKNKTLAILLIFQTFPVFIMAIVFQLIFAYQLGWFPAQGAYPPGIAPGDGEAWSSIVRHAILPLGVVTISGIPSLAILVKNIVEKIKKEPFIEAAYYFGIKNRFINIYYIIWNSLPDILGRLNVRFLYAIAGTLFVEIIFSYPGMGSLMRVAVSSRDYPLIQGIFLVISFYSIIINTLFELVLKKVDPRVAL